ncbi:MAG: hypothetical protein RL328_1284, partial [Acidobacteriota bacterium]
VNAANELVLNLPGAVVLNQGYLKNPDRFFLDLQGPRPESLTPTLERPNPWVDRVRIGQFDLITTRVVLDLKPQARVVVRVEPEAVILAVTGPAALVTQTAPAMEATLQAAIWAADASEIRLALDREAKYRLGRLKNPERIYIDLEDTRPAPQMVSTVPVPSMPTAAKAVRVGRFDARTTRVVVELDTAADAGVQRAPDSPDLVIQLGRRILTSTRGVPTPPVRVPATPLIPDLPPPDLEPQPSLLALSAPPQFVAAAMAMIAPVPDASPERMVESQGPPVQSSVSVQIPRVQKRPELEDILTAPEKLGVAVADFLQRQPRDGVPSTEKTTAYLAYDQQNLYVSFRAEDSERHIRARMSKREDIADDDLVTVYLDTFHDGQRAYYFTVNPLGLQADGMISGTGGVDARFDTLWYSSGRVTDTGYIVQLQIPFKSLRFSSASDQTWGIALSRVVRGKNETSFWPYITQRQRSLVQQMGVAEGMHEITPTRNIQLIPYAAFTGAQLSNGFTPGYKTQTDKRGGMDGKIVLRNALTLDFTIKPDFSQVESNDPLVTINRRFEVFFPEKRPFFLDNQNFFETPIGLLFTRRIAAPDYGARLTGRVGRWSIGMLGMDDRAPGRLAVGSLAGRETGIGVIRILRDVGRDSNLGVMATERRFGSSENRVFSLDARLRLSPTWYFSGQAAFSQDRQTDSSGRVRRLSAPAYTANLSRSGRNLSLFTNYEDYGRDFRAPLGFVPRVDVRRGTVGGSYLFRPLSGPVFAFGPTAFVGTNWDHTGRLQDKFRHVGYNMDFAGPVGFEFWRDDNYEYYLGNGLRYHSMGGSFYGNWVKQFTFYGGYQRGFGANYSPAADLQPYVGALRTAWGGFTWRPSTRFRMDEIYFYSSLGGPNGNKATAFMNHLERVKVNYQFTKALSVRGIFDYNFTNANPALFDATKVKAFTPDFLLTYLLNYGTALYIGYNQRMENLALNPDDPGTFYRFGAPTYPTSRQLYIKLSYLTRF